MLTAIALQRKKDDSWRKHLAAALDTADEYHFTRTISTYGAAVLPLLEMSEWSGNSQWHKRLMTAVRTQAAFYPDFLKTRLVPEEL